MSTLSVARDYLSLMKLKVVALLVVVAGVAATVAGDGFPPLDRLLLLLAAGALSSAGATALNHYLDRDIDAVMERTRRRPLPSHRIADPRHALVLGLLMVAASVPLALMLNYYVATYTLLGAAIYVLVYTFWLKRRSSLNIVVGGLAGSCAVAAGWATVAPKMNLVSLLVAAVVFLWTPTHFWSFALIHKKSYQNAGVPMMPAVTEDKRSAGYILLYSGITVAASVLLYFVGHFSTLYLAGALLLGGVFLASNVRLLRDPSQAVAWSNYKLSGVYLLGLFLLMFVDTVV